jgi:hypothetical protein
MILPPASLEAQSTQRLSFFPLSLRGRQRKTAPQLRCKKKYLGLRNIWNESLLPAGLDDFSFSASQRKAKK